MNKKGEKPESIGAEGLMVTAKPVDDKPMNYDLMQLDKKFSGNNNKKKKNKNKGNNSNSTSQNTAKPVQNNKIPPRKNVL